jgi:hypothetical protein
MNLLLNLFNRMYMKSSHIQLWLLIMICMLAGTTDSLAQFDKKFSLQGSIGVSRPLTGSKSNKTDQEGNPYLFNNFGYGLSLSFNGRYNISPRLAVGLDVGGTNFRNYTNTRNGAKDNSRLSDISFGPFINYYILNTHSFKIYGLAEPNINYYWGFQDAYTYALNDLDYAYFYVDNYDVTQYMQTDQVLIRKSAQKVSPSLAFGCKAGVGFEVRLSDFMNMVVQADYNNVFTKRVPTLRTNMSYLSFTGGLRLSLFKSKSLL